MSAKPRTVLVVDDEPKILEVVASYMESRGFRALQAETGREALDLFDRENVALVILDLMLPDISGEEVCRRIRNTSRVPVIMLTAKSDEASLITGLGIGADDYVTKPFSLKALAARVDAVLRRSGGDLVPLSVRASFRGGDLMVDFEKNVVKKAGREVSLTPSELKILSALIRVPGKVFTREELVELALGSEFDGYDRAIDSHVKNLRQKIEDDPRSPAYILTIHGTGYKFGGE
jgi:DNA-binding response OmpR family regulator